MGSSKSELVPDIDCPITATFMDAIHFVNSNDPVRFQGGLCLFELDLGVPAGSFPGFLSLPLCFPETWFVIPILVQLSKEVGKKYFRVTDK